MSSSETAQEAVEAEAAEQEPEARAEETAAPPRSATWFVAALVLAVVLTASLVVGGLLLRSVLDYRATADRRAAILSVATDVARQSYSLDYQTFPQQMPKIVAATTGAYRQGLIDSQQGLQYILTQGKVRSTCTITASGVERADDNSATVLFAITTHVTNTEITTPRDRFYRVAIGLVRQGETWLVQSNDVIA
ncbi:hypothetical protein HFP15_01535 [Amycolatopsis sp. K13G38]|uniref:Mce-associated membrane protein n=1 Tax=Amycolatopsis acididurans TaxID=2724524 RepID=A0ABX1IVN8_9PSEU|nr:hypothetical protein [Amycolatopsis acididurans]NKQ51557.1 hypothetical protein [Amycolatopsis acididurans]